jgi:predicted AAA+ superfamily ATPase
MIMERQRPEYLKLITESFAIHPIVAILGPRQCGKTTISRMYASSVEEEVHIFDLEDPADAQRLETPKLALDNLSGLVIIDEIQFSPNLFMYLRVLVDRPNNSARFLILGSASRDLIRQSSESLAGRIGYIELMPFSLFEVDDINHLWLRGGFPKSYLAVSEPASNKWRKDYVNTFLERDIPRLGINIPAAALRRCWAMLAHYHGNIFNASEIGNSLDISSPTVRRYLDILSGVFMVRQLQPWFINIKKRQVKAPKIYFRDSGLLHTLLGISNFEELQRHPKLGASWEGFALEEIVRTIHASSEECYFWATHGGAELDLLILKDGKKMGFEFKYTDAPKVTTSMRIAMQELELTELTVITPGQARFMISENIEAVGIERFIDTYV